MDLETIFADYQPKLMHRQKEYAVFVPLVEKDGQLCLLYQVRSAKMRRQPSEICFPGGAMEKGESPRESAVRELWEELAVEPKKIYGETDFLSLRTGDVIYPVLGELSPDSPIICAPEEVERVFYAPVSQLKAQNEKQTLILQANPLFTKETLSLKEAYHFREGKEEFAVYRVGEQVIWGITGRITEHVLSFL